MADKKFSFKKFISDEGLGKSKAKSNIRVGWDGRQDEVDHVREVMKNLKELSFKNFERYEESRATVVKLEELIEANKESVAKSTLIHDQNEELLDENKKINVMLEKIAKDIASYTNQLIQKDEEIAELNINYKQRIRELKKRK